MQPLERRKRPLILYIEDEPDLCEDVAEELEEAGYDTMLASDGKQALKVLDAVRPDLILCDITMPGMSGYDLLQTLRQTRPDMADVPFVFLTAQTDPRQVIDGKLAGADDYLIKPVDFDLMLATIQARITQIARIREHHLLEPPGLQEAFDDLHHQRRQETLGTITRAFDYVSFGIILLDADRTVRFANRAARRMVQSVPGMSLDGVFSLSDPRFVDAFEKARARTMQGGTEADDMVQCLAIARDTGHRDLLLMVCGLPHGCATDAEPIDGGAVTWDEGPVVMLMMADPAHRPAVAFKALESLFDLTPTEAQIANAFAEGKRTEEIARQFHISTTTVNFHKRNLFDKTGTNRQADLIALMLSLPAHDEA